MNLKPAQPAPLQAPAIAERDGFRQLPRTAAMHRAVLSALPCMNAVEVSAGFAAPLAFPLTVAAWNLERCYYVEESAELLKAQAPDIVLLSEVDDGMARTGQRHTAQELARALTMNHAFAVEFLELDIGGPTEQARATDTFNAKGFHGNALLSTGPLSALALLRLDDHGSWFGPDIHEFRIGGRCAILATVPVADTALVAVSVHLESRADGAYRDAEMRDLLAAVDAYAGDLPVIIGGDLNTAIQTEADFAKEPLFARAEAAGFDRHGGPMDRMTTRASTISPEAKPGRKLDWFLTRGLEIREGRVVDALSPSGTPLSDHELVVLEIAGLAA